MKNLKDIIKESLLDDADEIMKPIDSVFDNPFKYLANITYSEGSNNDKYREIMRNVEISTKNDSKEISFDKSVKYKIGFKYSKSSFSTPIIVVKSGRNTYIIYGSDHYAMAAPYVYCLSGRYGSKLFKQCDSVYVPSQKLIDQWLEFLSLCCTASSKDLYAKEWEAWEKYKKS